MCVYSARILHVTFFAHGDILPQGLDEECGGPWSAYGKCGYGLTCLKDARECPYLFHPRGSAADTGSNICDDYLFNGEIHRTPFIDEFT